MVEQNFENRTLYHGDNLAFLRGMNTGTVHLIATDPPFNKSKDFHATPDSLSAGASFVDRWSWDRDVHADWVDAIQNDWPAAWKAIDNARTVAGEDMGAFLCWLGVRLMEMHRVLAEDGNIYLHIDHTAHAYVKTLMDAISGRKNFRNEIVWCYSTSGRAKRFFAPKHDTILLYTKSAKGYWGDYRIPVSEKYLESHYRQRDADGNRVRIRVDAGKERVYYPDEGMTCNDWWEIPYVNSMSKERTGYPTQKPLPLYERMVEASSRKGDVVLDPFCGCATTPVAAERLGRQWVGMDIWDGAVEVVRQRMEDNRQLLVDADPETHYLTVPAIRTDDGREAAPSLVLKMPLPKEPSGPKMTNAQMKDFLVQSKGIVCEGCDRRFDDARYLQLDHNAPRSQGGINHISNRLLLCGPCNNTKSDKFTRNGLRAENKKRGWMAKE